MLKPSLSSLNNPAASGQPTTRRRSPSTVAFRLMPTGTKPISTISTALEMIKDRGPDQLQQAIAAIPVEPGIRKRQSLG